MVGSVPPIRMCRVGEISFTVMLLADAIHLVLSASERIGTGTLGHPGLAVHFCNAYNVALARRHAGYAKLLDRGDIVFTDGVPVTWVGRRAYPAQAAAWDRVYGPDVMHGVLAASTSDGPQHYLLGGSPATLDALQARIAHDYPDARVVGAESPPFSHAAPQELAARDARIADSGASIVWVGLGTPKQDVEVARLAGTLPVVALAVGAAFDFLAGTKPQAPVWMQRSGLEWAFRLADEPGRLGHRYLWGNSVFLAEAVRTILSRER